MVSQKKLIATHGRLCDKIQCIMFKNNSKKWVINSEGALNWIESYPISRGKVY